MGFNVLKAQTLKNIVFKLSNGPYYIPLAQKLMKKEEKKNMKKLVFLLVPDLSYDPARMKI